MVAGADRIGIAAGRIGGALAAGPLDPARFATGAASGGEGQSVDVVDAGANEGRLFRDADGEGPGAATLIARVAGDPGIGAGDICIF